MKGKADNAGIKATLVRVVGLAVDLSAKSAEGLPARMKILNWGENPNARGKRVFVGDKLVRALNAPVYPFRTIPLDYEHNTLKGTPAYLESAEPRKVAAFCRVEAVPGQGVFLCVQAWTPDGLANAANYCDLSAAPVTDGDGEVYAVLSAALCRCGAVEGMDFKEVAVSLSADALSVINPTEDKGLNWKELICKALGMDPACSDEELQKAVAALKPADATALNAAVAKAVSEAVKPLQTQVTALSADAGTFRAELAKRDRQSALDRARAEGRVVALSASVLEKMTQAELDAHIAQVPVTVPLSAKTPETLAPDAGAAGGPTAEQSAVALNCGMDPAAVWPAKR